MPLQDANPTPSFGGFGLRKVHRLSRRLVTVLVFLRLYLASKVSQYSLNLSSGMAPFPIANGAGPGHHRLSSLFGNHVPHDSFSSFK